MCASICEIRDKKKYRKYRLKISRIRLKIAFVSVFFILIIRESNFFINLKISREQNTKNNALKQQTITYLELSMFRKCFV